MPVAKGFEEFKGFKEFELSVSRGSRFFASELPITCVSTWIRHAASDSVPESGIPRRDSGLKMAKVLGVEGVELLRCRGKVNLCLREPSPPT
jgi:hypothetical protein